MDVKTPFINEHLLGDVYIVQLKSFVVPKHSNNYVSLICMLMD